MSEPNPELLILLVTFVALALAPLSSRLVSRVGNAISNEVDGGRSGDELDEHLDASYEGRMRDDEIAQMMAARAYLRRERGLDDAEPAPQDDAVPPPAPVEAPDDLREEVRQIVVAANERRARQGEAPLDVEAEVERRLTRLLGGAG